MAPKWTPQMFEEALELLRQRVAITREEFDAIYTAARAKAFTVAAIESVDVISIIQDTIADAIEEGISSAEWRKRVSEVVDRAGWKMQGDAKTARLENVFRTNVMAAYGEGRYQQQTEMADLYPYARYNAIGDDRTREEHQALDGTVSPIGSAFWQTHYPPWDFQCRCYAEPLSADEVDPADLVTAPKYESDFGSPAAGVTPEQILDRLTPDQRALAESLINISA
jgi:SPP1 gp7 family putative phage head morphogenesis protein